MKIGVFDSGIGGLSVARALERAFPSDTILFRHDLPDHFPYATKTPDEIFGYVVPVLRSLVSDGCALIVVACNTVSTTLITRLRQEITVPLVAVEPMVKPAAEQTRSGIVAVCATPATLQSARYAELKKRYGKGIKVLEPDCADWSQLIENDTMNQTRLRRSILPVLVKGADVIVLGCTHYHWIEDEIQQLAGELATVIQPEPAIVDQVKRVRAQLV